MKPNISLACKKSPCSPPAKKRNKKIKKTEDAKFYQIETKFSE